MLRGLLVVSNNGIPVYTFFAQDVNMDQKTLISGFLLAMQAFAGETSSSPDGGGIRSIELSENLLTFRQIVLHTGMGKPIQYYFVLLTEVVREQQPEIVTLLEYLTLSFLNYDGAKLRTKLKESLNSEGEFKAFDEFMGQITDANWKTIVKSLKPAPGSLLQGVLNEIKDYVPLSHVVRLHPKIVALGPSYAWLSDDLPQEEEKELLGRVRELLSNMFGESLYDSVIARVRKQLSGETFNKPLTRRELKSYPCPVCKTMISGIVIMEEDILQSKRSPAIVPAKCPKRHDIALYVDKQFMIRDAEPLIDPMGTSKPILDRVRRLSRMVTRRDN